MKCRVNGTKQVVVSVKNTASGMKFAAVLSVRTESHLFMVSLLPSFVRYHCYQIVRPPTFLILFAYISHTFAYVSQNVVSFGIQNWGPNFLLPFPSLFLLPLSLPFSVSPCSHSAVSLVLSRPSISLDQPTASALACSARRASRLVLSYVQGDQTFEVCPLDRVRVATPLTYI